MTSRPAIPGDMGAAALRMHREINPATGRRWTILEIARALSRLDRTTVVGVKPIGHDPRFAELDQAIMRARAMVRPHLWRE